MRRSSSNNPHIPLLLTSMSITWITHQVKTPTRTTRKENDAFGRSKGPACYLAQHATRRWILDIKISRVGLHLSGKQVWSIRKTDQDVSFGDKILVAAYSRRSVECRMAPRGVERSCSTTDLGIYTDLRSTALAPYTQLPNIKSFHCHRAQVSTRRKPTPTVLPLSPSTGHYENFGSFWTRAQQGWPHRIFRYSKGLRSLLTAYRNSELVHFTVGWVLLSLHCFTVWMEYRSSLLHQLSVPICEMYSPQS